MPMEKDSFLLDMFRSRDRGFKGFLTVQELHDLYGELRTEMLSLAQVQASVRTACLGDVCVSDEFIACLKEMDRRYVLVQDLQWEFCMLAVEGGGGLVSERQAEFLMRAAHNEAFSSKRWNRWLRKRGPQIGSGISFEEIEVELCNLYGDGLSIEEEEEEEELPEEKVIPTLSRARKLAAVMRPERQKENEAITIRPRKSVEEVPLTKRLSRVEKKVSINKEEAKRKDSKKREEELTGIPPVTKPQLEVSAAPSKLEEKEKDKDKPKPPEVPAPSKPKEKDEPKPPEVVPVQSKPKEEPQPEPAAPSKPKEKGKDKGKSAKEAGDAEAKRAKAKKINAQLDHALTSKKIDDLEPAVKEAEENKKSLGKELDVNKLEEAKALLKKLVAAKNLDDAVARRKIEALQKAMSDVKSAGLEEKLAKEMAEANQLLTRLKKLEQFRKEVLNLDQRTIAELKSYGKPPQVVHDVMMAVFILLGHPEKEMRKWQTVQTLIGRTGKENLKRRVGSCDPANIGMDAATKAERIIKADDLSSVSEASKGAAVFYVWVDGMIEEVKEHARNKKT